MPLLVNAQQVSKTFGIAPLFRNVSLSVSSGDRIGLIGPNGSGKSTLVQILAGLIPPDAGEVAIRRGTRIACVMQHSEFAFGQSVKSVVQDAMQRAAVPETDRAAILAGILGRAGFTDLDVSATDLSGGWRKRLAIVTGLVQMPDLLFLDEPTNHLDLAGIRWLESVLASVSCACVIVSHDRYLLESSATEIVELSKTYEDGLLRVKGTYSDFLEARQEYLLAQGRLRESLANRVRTEIEWLRRGPKARGTKAKARIENAREMIDELADLNQRSRAATAQIEFSATQRQTKQLIELEDLEYSIGTRTLFSNFSLIVKPSMRIGLMGPNGSGKTTLLRILRGDLEPSRGTVRRATGLRIVYFDQDRVLDPDISLKRTLAPDGDSVLYQGRLIHVASWASRFLFTNEMLNQPVGRLSGGERARVLIAQLILQPADVLLLDEPTNDLDIPTLEVLEESLLEFSGALLVVTHDRYLLDRITTSVVGLDGLGNCQQFADYSQWETWQLAQHAQTKEPPPSSSRKKAGGNETNTGRRKLSYLEAREFAGIEERIAAAEEELRSAQAALEDPAVASDGPKLLEITARIEAAQKAVDALYARWAELDEKSAKP